MRLKSTFAALAVASALAALAPPAPAAEPVKTDERRTIALADAFRDVAVKVAPSVVVVRSREGDDLGFGVAVGDGSLVLTSASILERIRDNHVGLGTPGGQTRYASILGRNEAYDVALLGMQPSSAPLKALPFGSSKKLAIGQWVVTIGTTPERPLAVGVVSALDRRVEPRAEARAFDLFGLFADSGGPKRAYARIIQHDSPIDGDKHGAPLVDADGKLVGINLASAYRGSAYAAPIDDVAAFLEDLRAGRPGPPMPKPGYLGVAIGSVTDRAVAKRLGIAGPGVQIHAVTKGFPAEKAGLRAGDVLLGIDGEKVASAERFGQLVRGTLPGTSLRVRVLRGGTEEVEVTVQVAERPASEE